MKARLLVLLLLVCGATSFSEAATRLQFSVWMRAIDNKTVSVQKHLAAGREAEALADARALQQLYADMAAFFERDYPAADAVAISRDGERLAAAIPVHLATGDAVGAAQAARAIALACNDCHDPYKPLP
ncbi:MAG: hypothetical protein EKK52_00050 [Burkholderiales bacterium]|jgi:hypothetical protein|nr:hypothetical protein [Methylibium sp.]MBY0366516.1 hypothetical protein [Burkholderiaceae bacterium]RTL24889.1 MAG: hypothetical protein EKK52_00050 [Burkholderiales bacterium]|mmetsp:Transcript_81534/g.226802  ORF Transcript_81534/g.226802 Transcript_81534/m.226802 type:complete len:129 (+) Transcript_81534:1196-1582(+)